MENHTAAEADRRGFERQSNGRREQHHEGFISAGCVARYQGEFQPGEEEQRPQYRLRVDLQQRQQAAAEAQRERYLNSAEKKDAAVGARAKTILACQTTCTVTHRHRAERATNEIHQANADGDSAFGGGSLGKKIA